MREALKAWRHKRQLRALGKVNVLDSIRYAERKQNDCLPWMIQVEFCTVEWITAKRKLPKVGISRLGGKR